MLGGAAADYKNIRILSLVNEKSLKRIRVYRAV
jgi:hypothetical protein